MDFSGMIKAIKEWCISKFLTEVPSGYAKTEDIPTKTSDIENDSGFIGSSNILKTYEEIQANTSENNVAGALAVKEGFNNLGGFKPVIDSGTGQITGYTTTIGGADTVFPFPKKIIGTFTTSTSSAVTVNLGFKPKILFIKGSNHENMYSEDINRCVRITVSGKTAEVIGLSNASNNRINSINTDGFTYGKSNVGVETMSYYAYG